MNVLGHRLARDAQGAADHVRVPAAPRRPLGALVASLLQTAADTHLLAYAGNVAFRCLFALFPTLISLPWLLKVAHAIKLVDALLGLVSTVVPHPVNDVIRQQLTAVPRAHAGTDFTISALLSLGVAVLAITAACRATMDALNVIQGVRERRPLWKRYLIALLLSGTVAALLVAALGLVFLGSGIAALLAKSSGHAAVFRWVWLAAVWLALLLLVLVAFALIYYFAPDRKQPFRLVSEGAIVALVLWLVFSLLFHGYVDHLVAYTETYGALAGIAVLMIYSYAVSSIVLVGAALDRALEGEPPRGSSRPDAPPLP